ncbi:MAG: RuvA C-terminal domain-containing protein [Candidatus Eisenbacteria bacterium]
MHPYALSHLSDDVLVRDLFALVAQERRTTASLLAHIAEVDVRRIYAPAGYPSMHAYCVGELRLSDDAALKRIQAARAARRFPTIFEAVADGRLHLSGICLLAPWLTKANAGELLEEAAGRRKSEIEAMLARHFPPRRAEAAVIRPVLEHAPGHVGSGATSGHAGSGADTALSLLDSDHANGGEHAPGHVDEDRNQGLPLSPDRFLVQVTVGASTREKLRHAQALLSHAVPSGDVAEVLDRALDALITALEKRRLGVRSKGSARSQAASHRRPASNRSAAANRTAGTKREAGSGSEVGRRHIALSVRRAVWERDGGQCTFVSAGGRRCQARRFLEFDHVDPVARGGETTVDRIRLRCRAHNQYEAERAYGAEFMRRKREAARCAAAEKDVLSGLRNLGFRADEAHRAVEQTRPTPGATLEERFRAALYFLGRGKTHGHRSAG